jgi:hypothetical protein
MKKLSRTKLVLEKKTLLSLTRVVGGIPEVRDDEPVTDGCSESCGPNTEPRDTGYSYRTKVNSANVC